MSPTPADRYYTSTKAHFREPLQKLKCVTQFLAMTVRVVVSEERIGVGHRSNSVQEVHLSA